MRNGNTAMLNELNLVDEQLEGKRRRGEGGHRISDLESHYNIIAFPRHTKDSSIFPKMNIGLVKRGFSDTYIPKSEFRY